MTNVLPLGAQKELWSTHRARFLAVFALVLLILSLVAALSLLPSFVALELNTQSAETSAEATTAAEGLRAMTKAQAQLAIVTPIVASTTTTPTVAVETALALRPKGVTVDRVRYVGGAQKQIVLAGAASREGLTAYRTALEADAMFTGVSVPVGALFGESGRFSITLVGRF